MLNKEDTARYEFARGYATAKHRGMKRKYTGEDYIVHPISVANTISEDIYDIDLIIAALLHDVVEDTDTTIDEIYELFGLAVAEIVFWVTTVDREVTSPELLDVLNKANEDTIIEYELMLESYKHNRAYRKPVENRRMSLAPYKAQVLRLYDINHNLSQLSKDDARFCLLYINEKITMIETMKEEVVSMAFYKTLHSDLIDKRREYELYCASW